MDDLVTWLRWPVDLVEGIASMCCRHPWLGWFLFGVVSAEWGLFVWMTW